MTEVGFEPTPLKRLEKKIKRTQRERKRKLNLKIFFFFNLIPNKIKKKIPGGDMKPRIAGANDDRETSTDNMWDYNKGRWITYYNTGDAVDAQMTISSRIHDRMRYQLHNLTMEERHWRLPGPRDGNWSPNRTLNGFQYDQYFKEIITERSPPHGVSHRKPTKWFRVCQEKWHTLTMDPRNGKHT